MSAVIGALRAVLSLDSAAFEKGSKRAQVSMGSMERRMRQTAQRMKKYGNRLSLAVTAPLAGMAALAVKSSLGIVDAQAKLAQSMNTTVESVQVLKRAGELAGVSMAQMETAARDLTQRLSQAAAGGGPAADALTKLGLSAEELLKLPLDERISKVNGAINAFIPAAQQATVAGQLFGTRGWAAMGRVDSATIKIAARDVRDFGVAMSEADADQIELANDAISRLGLIMRGVGNQLATALAPTLQALADKAAGVAKWFNGLSDTSKRFTAVAAAMAAALGPVAIALGLIVTAVTPLIGLMGTLSAAFVAMTVSLSSMAGGLGVAGVATRALTGTLTLLRGAVSVALGPWGILAGLVAGAASYFLAFGKAGDAAASGAKSADDATLLLNSELGFFHKRAAPEAGKKAVELANDLVSEANAAYEAAQAYVALQKVRVEEVKARVALQPNNLFGSDEVAMEEEDLAAATAYLAEQEKILNAAMQKRKRVVNDMTSSMHGYEVATEKANDDVKVTIDGLGALGSGAGAAADEVDNLANSFESPLTSAVTSFSDAWGDFITRGFRDFKGFAKSILNSFKSMLSQMISMSLRNRIMISLGIGGAATGVGSAAGAGGNALAGAATQGILGKVLGTGGLLGSAISGLGAGIANLSGSVATLSGILQGGSLTAWTAGAAFPAVAIIAGVALLAKKLFGRTLKSAGIRGEFGGKDGFEGSAYKFFKGGWFRSDKTELTALDDETRTGLSSAFLNIRDTTKSYIETLGLAAKSIRGFSHEIDIITIGKSQEEITGQIQTQLGLAADGLANLALGTEAYTLAGETSSATLARLATSLSSVNTALEVLGQNLLDASLKGGDAASKLVDLFGGIQGFNAATTSYFNAFYSEEARTAATLRGLTKELQTLGVAMPRTRAEFRALVEMQDLSSSSGRELYATLLRLAEGFNQILPAAETLSAQMAEIASDIAVQIDGRIADASALARTSEAASRLWSQTATTLRAFLRDLAGTELSGSSKADQHLANQNNYRLALDAVKGGDVAAAKDLPKLAQAFLKSAQGRAKSGNDFALTAARTRNELSLAAGIADLETSQEDIIAALSEKQIEVLTDLKSYIAAGNIDSDVLQKFSGELASLGSTIRKAELFSYDYLRERLQVTVDVIADAKLPKHLKTLLRNARDGISSTIDFLVRSDELTPDLKWIALTGASELTKTLRLSLAGEGSVRLAKIALNDVTALTKSINLVAGSKLDHQLKSLALTETSNLTKVINATLSSDLTRQRKKLLLSDATAGLRDIVLSVDKARIGKKTLPLLVEQLTSAQRKIALSVNMSKLSKSQKRILQAVTAGTDGKLVMSGGFVLDPSDAFQQWYENNTKANIESPMAALRSKIGDLVGAIAEDLKFRQQQLRQSARLNAAGAKLASLEDRRAVKIGATQTIIDRIKDLEASTGTDMRYKSGDDIMYIGADGKVNYKSDGHIGGDITAFRKQFYGAKGLQSKLLDGKKALTIFFKKIEAQKEKIAKLQEAFAGASKSIPGFASGGKHSGGWRVVGERGWEMEHTGASRVISNSDASRMLDNSAVVAEQRRATAEMGRMRSQMVQLLLRIDRHTDEASGSLRKFDVLGLKDRIA